MIGLSAEQKGRMGHGSGTQVLSVLPQQIHTGHQPRGIRESLLDFDSTVMVREGEQEGAVKGYNPKRPGRNSHHPLIAFVSDIRMIAVYWLRPGNTAASTKHLSFLEDTLKNLSGKRGDPIRMDSGFFTKETLDSLGYIVAYRFTWPIKRELVGGKAWVDVADGIEMTETVYQAQSRTAPRRIVMVRQEIEKQPAAAGKLVKQLCLLEDQWISGNSAIAVS